MVIFEFDSAKMDKIIFQITFANFVHSFSKATPRNSSSVLIPMLPEIFTQAVAGYSPSRFFMKLRHASS